MGWIRLLDVAGVIYDPAVYQVRGLISLQNYIHAVPAVAVLKVPRLQDAQRVARRAADTSAGLPDHRHTSEKRER